MSDIVIRKYEEKDREAVRHIAFETALIGESAEGLLDGKEILTDFLTLYYTDFEPQSTFVAESSGKVVGYLMGAKNARTLRGVFLSKIFPGLLFKTIIKGAFFTKKNFLFLRRSFASLLQGEFRMPDYSEKYPAVLHINVASPYRKLNIGSRLLSCFTDYLYKSKVSGVHLTTMSGKAAVFFERHGFQRLFEGKRSFFSHVLKRDMPIFIYGKRI